MERGARNLAWATALFEGLLRAGLRDVCVAPGSRSTPLVLALAEAEGLRRFVHLDERSAAFFALGIGKRTGRPAAVVTTSGTAVANLHPAVLEASRSGAPLLLLTADRPPRLRGTDANQTVHQPGLFGGAVRLFHDVGTPSEDPADLGYVRALASRAWSAALGRPAGPVHLNLPFEKPLQPEPGAAGGRREGEVGREGGVGGDRSSPGSAVAATRRTAEPATGIRLTGRVSGSSRGVIVAGPDPDSDRLGPAARELARATGWPLLADPLSGARFGEDAGGTALGAYDLFLRSGAVREALRPDLVLRFGGPPTSRVLHDYVEGAGEAHRVVVSDQEPWPDHGGAADEVVRADPATLCEELAGRVVGGTGGVAGEWRERWHALERASRRAAGGALDASPPEGAVLEVVARSAPAGATLFVGSSMPVRDLDAFGAPRDAALAVVGNRGASGIDGSVSTALGAAVGAGGPAVAVIGDLALLHDVNGLRAASAYGIPLVLVVIDNDGGGIFHLLPVRRHEPHFEPYFGTPHGLDLGHAAALYGVRHRRLETEVGGAGGEGGEGEGLQGELQRALGEALAGGAPAVIEVPSDREENRVRRDAAVRAAVEAAERCL